MGAIFGIALGFTVSVAFLALSLGYIPMDESIPVPLRIFIFVIATVMLLVSIASVRFRIKRRIAIASGRERNGTVILRGRLDKEGGSAMLLFATSYEEWLLAASPQDLKCPESELRDGVKAKATVGEDERVYALRIGRHDVPLSSPGILFEGRMRDMVIKAEQNFAIMEQKRAG